VAADGGSGSVPNGGFARRGRCARAAVQIGGASAVPSAVYLEQDGRLLVGLEAQRRAEHDPARCEPSPTMRIPETNLLLPSPG